MYIYTVDLPTFTFQISKMQVLVYNFNPHVFFNGIFTQIYHTNQQNVKSTIHGSYGYYLCTVVH